MNELNIDIASYLAYSQGHGRSTLAQNGRKKIQPKVSVGSHL